MLTEMRFIEQELIPKLRERRAVQEEKATRQLCQWAGEPGMCSYLLSISGEDIPEMKYLPDYDLEEIHYDPEKMFVSQLRGALCTAFAHGDAVPSVRANVGCGCINTLLGGVSQTFYPDKMPWLLQHLAGEQLKNLTKDDITDSPEFSFGLECMSLMKEELDGTGIEVFPMDIQGPIDMAHLWLGDEFFYEVYDDPELVHHTLQLAVDCIEYAFRKNLDIIKPDKYVCHYNGLVLPIDKPLKISEDTSTLLCGEHLEEYMIPYTEKLLRNIGGGYIHYCGDNKHLLPITETLKGSIGLNFGNPERHDFSRVLPALGENGKCYIMASHPLPEDDFIKYAHRQDGSFNVFINGWCRKADQESKVASFREKVAKMA